MSILLFTRIPGLRCLRSPLIAAAAAARTAQQNVVLTNVRINQRSTASEGERQRAEAASQQAERESGQPSRTLAPGRLGGRPALSPRGVTRPDLAAQPAPPFAFPLRFHSTLRKSAQPARKPLAGGGTERAAGRPTCDELRRSPRAPPRSRSCAAALRTAEKVPSRGFFCEPSTSSRDAELQRTRPLWGIEARA